MSLLKALRPIIVKEFRQIRRDPTSLGMLLILPSAIIVLGGYALNLDVKHIPIAIYDQNKTSQSRDFLNVFTHSEYFDHMYTVDSHAEIERLFDGGDAKLAVVVPVSFAQDLFAGRNVKVQFLVDGSDANSASQAIGYAIGMTNSYSNRLTARALFRQGKEAYVPIDFQPRIWYNPNLISSQFLIPGLIGFILVLTAVVSTSMTVVREKERGTMEQIMVSPLRPIDIILGKTVPYMVVSFVAITMIIIIGYFLFSVPIRGSLLLLYAAIFVLLLGALGQGLLISTVTNSQQVAFMISIFSSLLPSFLLSGFIFPISSMPVVLQVISNVAVTKFFLVVVRGIMLKGVGLEAFWDQFLYMAIFALFTLGISVLRMQKRSA
ncbi:MAG: ABC transporter permease [Ignavibacteria bacterium]|nr:ABC transporter permease [Ignavibacteria bacterium]